MAMPFVCSCKWSRDESKHRRRNLVFTHRTALLHIAFTGGNFSFPKVSKNKSEESRGGPKNKKAKRAVVR
jgi:hypothetical protein